MGRPRKYGSLGLVTPSQIQRHKDAERMKHDWLFDYEELDRYDRLVHRSHCAICNKAITRDANTGRIIYY